MRRKLSALVVNRQKFSIVKLLANLVAPFAPGFATYSILGLKPVQGRQELGVLLKAVNDRLEAVTKSKEKGEDVDPTHEEALKAERQRILEEIGKEQAEKANGGGSGGGGGEPAPVATEGDDAPTYDQLLAWKQSQDLKEAGVAIARSVEQNVAGKRAALGQELGTIVKDQLKTAGIIGDGDENPLVKAAVDQTLAQLTGARTPSRALLPGADPSLVEHVAKGGGLDLAERPDATVVGAPGAEEIRKSKSFVKAYAAALNVKNGMASDGELQFYREQRQKAMALGTDSAGGFLVPPEFLDEVIELLAPYTTVRRAGAEEVPFDKSLSAHTVTGEPTAYYTLENAHISPSELTLGEVPLLTPKELTGFVPVSNRLLRATAQAEGLVRRTLAKVIGLREDLAFLQGSGGSEPLGFRNMVGITQNPLSLAAGTGRENGFYPNLMDLRRVRASMRRQNPVNPRPVWFFHIDILTNLETLTDSTGRPLLETPILQINEDGASGRIDGVPFFTTTQIPTNVAQGTDPNTTYALLVNMEEALIGLGQEMEIEASSEASYTPDGGTTHVHMFQARQTGFRATLVHDLTHKRKSQVLIQYGIKLPA